MQWEHPVTRLFDFGTNVQEWSSSVLKPTAEETETRAVILGNGWRRHEVDQDKLIRSFIHFPQFERRRIHGIHPSGGHWLPLCGDALGKR